MRLELRDLVVSVGGTTVLKGVSLAVPQGELHVIMGPNGSGKSTLLASIMGLPHVRIESGKILFEGRDITNLPPTRELDSE